MPAISTQELKSLLERNEDVLVINTLPSKYFEDTKIPTAVNIPQDEENFIKQVEQVATSKEQKIVVYCANLDCDSSTEAAKKLDAAGFTNVYDYRVGAKGWQEETAEVAAKTTG